MKTLQQLCPTLNNAELRLIWREVEALIPPHNTIAETAEDEVWNSGYNEAMTEVTIFLKNFIAPNTKEGE